MEGGASPRETRAPADGVLPRSPAPNGWRESSPRERARVQSAGAALRRRTLASNLLPGAGLAAIGESEGYGYLALTAVLAAVLAAIPLSGAVVGVGAAAWSLLWIYSARTMARLRLPRVLPDSYERIAEWQNTIGASRGGCARCGELVRDFGFCAICAEALRAHQLDRTDPMSLAAYAPLLNSHPALAEYRRPMVCEHTGIGDIVWRSTRQKRVVQQVATAATSSARQRVDAVYGDPADPNVRWIRATGHALLTDGTPVVDETIVRAIYEDGRVVATWAFGRIGFPEGSPSLRRAAAKPARIVPGSGRT